VVEGVDPIAQQGEQVIARTAEDLEEQSLPGGPIGCRGVLSRPKKVARGLGGSWV